MDSIVALRIDDALQFVSLEYSLEIVGSRCTPGYTGEAMKIRPVGVVINK